MSGTSSSIGIHVTQLRRYEAATAQHTLDVLRRLKTPRPRATRLDPRFSSSIRTSGPDDKLHLQFEALKALDPEEKKVVRSVLESILIKHDAKRWMGSGV